MTTTTSPPQASFIVSPIRPQQPSHHHQQQPQQHYQQPQSTKSNDKSVIPQKQQQPQPPTQQQSNPVFPTQHKPPPSTINDYIPFYSSPPRTLTNQDSTLPTTHFLPSPIDPIQHPLYTYTQMLNLIYTPPRLERFLTFAVLYLLRDFLIHFFWLPFQILLFIWQLLISCKYECTQAQNDDDDDDGGLFSQQQQQQQHQQRHQNTDNLSTNNFNNQQSDTTDISFRLSEQRQSNVSFIGASSTINNNNVINNNIAPSTAITATATSDYYSHFSPSTTSINDRNGQSKTIPFNENDQYQTQYSQSSDHQNDNEPRHLSTQTPLRSIKPPQQPTGTTIKVNSFNNTNNCHHIYRSTANQSHILNDDEPRFESIVDGDDHLTNSTQYTNNLDTTTTTTTTTTKSPTANNNTSLNSSSGSLMLISNPLDQSQPEYSDQNHHQQQHFPEELSQSSSFITTAPTATATTTTTTTADVIKPTSILRPSLSSSSSTSSSSPSPPSLIFHLPNQQQPQLSPIITSIVPVEPTATIIGNEIDSLSIQPIPASHVTLTSTVTLLSPPSQPSPTSSSLPPNNPNTTNITLSQHQQRRLSQQSIQVLPLQFSTPHDHQHYHHHYDDDGDIVYDHNTSMIDGHPLGNELTIGSFPQPNFSSASSSNALSSTSYTTLPVSNAPLRPIQPVEQVSMEGQSSRPNTASKSDNLLKSTTTTSTTPLTPSTTPNPTPHLTSLPFYTLLSVLPQLIIVYILIVYTSTSALYHYIRALSSMKLLAILGMSNILDKLLTTIGNDVTDWYFVSLDVLKVKYIESVTVSAVSPPELNKDIRDKFISTFLPTFLPLYNHADYSPTGFQSVTTNNTNNINSYNKPQQPKLPSTRILFIPMVFYTLYLLVHSFFILIQVTATHIALNSTDGTFYVLVTTVNFAELKSFVFKKYFFITLFQITVSDVAERAQFTLHSILVFMTSIGYIGTSMFTQGQDNPVIDPVQHSFGLSSSHTISSTAPSMYIPLLSSNIFTWCLSAGKMLLLLYTTKVIIDWIKHIFMTKFNRLPSHYLLYTHLIARDIYRCCNIPCSIATRSLQRLRLKTNVEPIQLHISIKPMK
jgi:hypothetical protein